MIKALKNSKAFQLTRAFRLAKRSRRLLLLAVLILSLPLLIGNYALQSAQKQLRETSDVLRLTIARSIASEISIALNSAAAGVRAVAAQPLIAQFLANRETGKLKSILSNVQKNAQFINLLAILDSNGEVIESFPAASDSYLTLEPIPGSDGLELLSGIRQKAGVATRTTIRSPDGEVIGAVIGVTSLENVFSIVKQRGFGMTGSVALLSQSGLVLLATNSEYAGTQARTPEVLQLLSSNGEGTLEFYAPSLQRDQLMAIAQVEKVPLAVSVSQSRAESFAPVEVLQSALLISMAVLASLGAALLAFALRDYLKFERQLREANGLFWSVIEGTQDAISVKDLNGRYVLVNSAAGEIIGRTPAEILGRTDRDIFDSEVAESIRTKDIKAMQTGEPVRDECMATGPRVARVLLTARAPYRNAHGEIRGVISIARDITNLRQAEEKLAELAESMRQVNTINSLPPDN